MKKTKFIVKNKEGIFLNITRLSATLLILVSYLLLLVESYSYIGFLRKFIFVDSRFFLTLSIISVFFLLLLKIIIKKYKEFDIEKLLVNFNFIIFPPLLIAYLVMIYLNLKNWPNYVFTKYHIQPQNFINIVYLSLAVLLLKFDSFYRKINLKFYLNAFFLKLVRKKKITLNEKFFFILSMLLFIYFVNNFKSVSKSIFDDINFMSTHINYSYDDKMRTIWGFYYDYMKFVKENVPLNATILVPPQTNLWPTVDNINLNRYFLYPRKQIHGELYTVPTRGYDYVLIARGLGQNREADLGWPKVYIKAEEILYIDPNTLKISKFKKNFDPKEDFNKNAWGLIKIKK